MKPITEERTEAHNKHIISRRNWRAKQKAIKSANKATRAEQRCGDGGWFKPYYESEAIAKAQEPSMKLRWVPYCAK